MSYEDIQKLEIKDNSIYMLLAVDMIILLSSFSNNFLIVYILIVILTILMYPLFSKYIGGGDIKVLLLLFPIIKEDILPLILVSSLLGLVFSILQKSKIIPFIPFITVGFILLEVKKLIN